MLPLKDAHSIATPLLADAGIVRPYIVIQAQHSVASVARAVHNRADLLDRYDILMLPIGPALGDDENSISTNCPEFKRLSAWPTPIQIAALIANSAGVIGVSLHLTITALSYGLPVLRPSHAKLDKYIFLNAIDAVLFMAPTDVVSDTFLKRLGTRKVDRFVTGAKAKLVLHWDRIAEAISGRGGSKGSRAESMDGLWSELPVAVDECMDDMVKSRELALVSAAAQHEQLQKATMAMSEEVGRRRQVQDDLKMLLAKYRELAVQEAALHANSTQELAQLRSQAELVRRDYDAIVAREADAMASAARELETERNRLAQALKDRDEIAARAADTMSNTARELELERTSLAQILQERDELVVREAALKASATNLVDKRQVALTLARRPITFDGPFLRPYDFGLRYCLD